MICAAYRWMISRSLDDNRALPGIARRHLERCPSCRWHYRILTELQDRLRRELPAEGPVPGAVSFRILQAAPGQPGPMRLTSRRRTAAALTALAAAACIVLAVTAVLLHGPPGPDRPAPLSLSPPEVPWTQFEQLATAPMAEELGNLAQDAYAAGQTLLACLPVEVAPVVGNWDWLTQAASALSPASAQAAEN